LSFIIIDFSAANPSPIDASAITTIAAAAVAGISGEGEI